MSFAPQFSPPPRFPRSAPAPCLHTLGDVQSLISPVMRRLFVIVISWSFWSQDTVIYCVQLRRFLFCCSAEVVLLQTPYQLIPVSSRISFSDFVLPAGRPCLHVRADIRQTFFAIRLFYGNPVTGPCARVLEKVGSLSLGGIRSL